MRILNKNLNTKFLIKFLFHPVGDEFDLVTRSNLNIKDKRQQ